MKRLLQIFIKQKLKNSMGSCKIYELWIYNRNYKK